MPLTWELSLAELKNGRGKCYKVTRRLPALGIAETKVFRSRSRAERQLASWLESAHLLP